MQILLNKGAEVDLCTATGVVPLFVACQYEHEKIARPLLKKGADIYNLSEETTKLVVCL